MTQFPAFGALFDTTSIAMKDLVNFSVGIFVIQLGFAIMASIMFGPEVTNFKTFLRTVEKLFYYTNGSGSIKEVDIKNQILFNCFYIIYSLIFYFILMKTLISIVSVRYRYLRSLKQLNNEANARIIKHKVQRTKDIVINLIL